MTETECRERSGITLTNAVCQPQDRTSPLSRQTSHTRMILSKSGLKIPQVRKPESVCCGNSHTAPLLLIAKARAALLSVPAPETSGGEESADLSHSFPTQSSALTVPGPATYS